MKHTNTKAPHPLLDFYPMTPQNKHLASKAFVNIIALDNTFSFYAQVDSGSEDSIITQGYLNQLNIKNLKIRPTRVKMITFGNQMLISKGYITTKVNFYKSPFTIDIDFLIDPTVKLFNAIIGQATGRIKRFDLDIGVIDPENCNLRQNCLEPSSDSISTPLFTNSLNDSSNVLKTQSLFRYSVPYLYAVISHRKVVILMDSGAVRSTVEASLLEDMELTDEILPQSGQLHGAAGAVKIVGTIILKIYLTSKTGITGIYSHKFWVSIGSGEDLSLGFTFLVQHNLVHSNSVNGLIDSNRDVIVDYFYPRDITASAAKTPLRNHDKLQPLPVQPQQILVKSNTHQSCASSERSNHSRALSHFSCENANSSDSSLDMESVHNNIMQETENSPDLINLKSPKSDKSQCSTPVQYPSPPPTIINNNITSNLEIRDSHALVMDELKHTMQSTSRDFLNDEIHNNHIQPILPFDTNTPQSNMIPQFDPHGSDISGVWDFRMER